MLRIEVGVSCNVELILISYVVSLSFVKEVTFSLKILVSCATFSKLTQSYEFICFIINKISLSILFTINLTLGSDSYIIAKGDSFFLLIIIISINEERIKLKSKKGSEFIEAPSSELKTKLQKFKFLGVNYFESQFKEYSLQVHWLPLFYKYSNEWRLSSRFGTRVFPKIDENEDEHFCFYSAGLILTFKLSNLLSNEFICFLSLFYFYVVQLVD